MYLKKEYEITDIMEMPDGNFWFTSWGDGIVAVDSSFKETNIDPFKSQFRPVGRTAQKERLL